MVEQLTPLHFASYRGNLDAIYVLIRNGADINSMSNNGINALHAAAQGNAVPPLYLFLMLGLDINSVDMRGSTPLHWAIYCGSEQALAYLLAKNPNVNI